MRIVATVFGFVVLVLLLSGTERHPVPGRAGRQLAQADSVDLSRRRAVRTDRHRRRPDVLAYIWGADVGGLFTALGVSSIVLGLDAAELGRADHLGPARVVRAAVPARRLDRNADGAWPRRRSQLARNTYRHRHGLLIMPNSVLAAASFTNSQPAARRTHHSRSPRCSRSTIRPTTSATMLNRVAARCRSCGRTRRRPDRLPVAGCSTGR